MSLEEEIISLNEQLVKEKADAREEKMRIEEEKYQTNLKASGQEDLNLEKSRYTFKTNRFEFGKMRFICVCVF